MILAVEEALLIYAPWPEVNIERHEMSWARATLMPDILNEEELATWAIRATLIGPKGHSHVTTLPVPSPARSMPLRLSTVTNYVPLDSHNMQPRANVTV
jgi:hypothetical protein